MWRQASVLEHLLLQTPSQLRVRCNAGAAAPIRQYQALHLLYVPVVGESQSHTERLVDLHRNRTYLYHGNENYTPNVSPREFFVLYFYLTLACTTAFSGRRHL